MHERRTHRPLRFVAVAGIAMLALAACGTQQTSTGDTPKNGGTLTWALDADAQSLNPFIAGDVPSVRALAPLFPNLYSADKNLNIVPDFADGMPQISSDGKVWTVKLKKAQKWSDGSPMTADDIVTTVNIQNNPDLDTDAGFDWAELDKVEKVDTNTVKFTLKEAFAPFLANNLVGPFAPASVYGKLDVKTMRNDPVSLNPTVTGGPYKFDKRVAGQEIDYVFNPNYYKGRPHYDKMIAKVITDAIAATNELTSGGVQWHPALGEAGQGAVTKAKAAPNTIVHQYADLGYIDVRLNHRAGHPFSQKEVRQAFAYALDKESIVKAATDGKAVALWGDIVPASWAYDDTAVVKYVQNVQKAKDLMKAAGYTIGADGIATKGGTKFSYNICFRAGKIQRQKAAEIISEQVKAIGMDLKPKGIDFKVFYKGKAKGGCGIQTGEFDLGIAGFGLALDPDEYTVIHSSQLQPEHKSGQNWSGYSNPELDKLVEQERSTIKATDAETKTARKAIFAKILKILGDDLQTYYLWADRAAMGWTGDVGGVTAGGGDNTLYYDQARNTSIFGDWWSKKAK
jgi:peptide/nickel transport system substrate-binding protein